MKIEVELTEAQAAAAATQMGAASGYELAQYLAQLPIEHAREHQDRVDEMQAWNRHTEGLLIACALAVRALADVLDWDEAAILKRCGTALAQAPPHADAVAMLERTLLSLTATADEQLIKRYGSPSPAQRAAQERIRAIQRGND